MAAKAKLDKLAGTIGWNKKSELMRTYGTLKVVIQGMREIFYDPNRLYLKRALEGVVEWPVTRDGRLGVKALEESAALMHWTPAADDPKAAGDPEGLNLKRQLLGTVMGHGGRCEVAILRQLLQGLDSAGAVDLESFFDASSPRNLSSVLFWSHRNVCRRQAKAVEAARPQMDDQVSADVRQVLIDVVNSKGSVSLSELQAALEEAKLAVKVDEAMLFHTAQRIPELFYFPEIVFLRHLVEPLIKEVPVALDTAMIDSAREEDEADAPQKVMPTEAEMEEDAAMLALAEAAAAIPDEAVGGAPAPKNKAPVKSDSGFFTYGEFEKQPEARMIEIAPVKRRRTASDAGAIKSVWGGDDVPPWATESAAVSVRNEGHATSEQIGIITRLTGTVATVMLMLGDKKALTGGLAGGALSEERDFPISKLLPVAPQVGASVKVVAGRSSGLQGTLVGLAGDKGVVQIGKIQYETLPMSHLAVTASFR